MDVCGGVFHGESFFHAERVLTAMPFGRQKLIDNLRSLARTERTHALGYDVWASEGYQPDWSRSCAEECRRKADFYDSMADCEEAQMGHDGWMEAAE